MVTGLLGFSETPPLELLLQAVAKLNTDTTQSNMHKIRFFISSSPLKLLITSGAHARGSRVLYICEHCISTSA
jgi:hypothetical protein